MRLLMVLPAVVLALSAADLEVEVQALLAAPLPELSRSKNQNRRSRPFHSRRRIERRRERSSAEARFAGGRASCSARVLKGQMPPAAPLPVAEKELLQRWIESGAPWSSCYLANGGRVLIGGRCSRLTHKRAAETAGDSGVMGEFADRSLDLCAPAPE